MAAGRGKNRSVHPAHFPTIHVFCGALWCVLHSELLFLPWFSCPATAASLCNLPSGCVTTSPKRLGPVLACSYLPPSYRPWGFSLPSVVRDLTISPVCKHLSTGCPGSGCAFEKLLVYTVRWYQLIPCTELQCTSLGMRPVSKTGSSARKMGKCLQLDFSYTGKGDNNIFFSLFSLIPF